MDNLQPENLRDDQIDASGLAAVSSLELVNATWLAQFLVLTGSAIFLPFFIHLPWITGPIVNAILILILFLCGRNSAFLACCLPSLMALSGGLLPAVLAPAIPFIIISNLIFVLALDWTYKKMKSDFNGYLLGVLTGAGLKFVFLSFSVNILAAFFIKTPIMPIVIKMFGWSQLLTAILGGLIAWFILKFLKYFN